MNAKLTLLKMMLLGAAVAAFTLSAVACGDDDDGGTTPASVTATASPTKPAEPTATGVPPTPTKTAAEADMAKVEPVVNALRDGDTAKLLSLVKYTPVACADNVQGFPQPPKCGGKPAGTKIESFPWASCEGAYALPGEMGPIVQNFNGKLYKVYKQPAEKGSAEFPQGIYGVIYYTGSDSGAQNTGRLIALDADGKIVSYWSGCGARAWDVDYVRGAGATTVLIPQ